MFKSQKMVRFSFPTEHTHTQKAPGSSGLSTKVDNNFSCQAQKWQNGTKVVDIWLMCYIPSLLKPYESHFLLKILELDRFWTHYTFTAWKRAAWTVWKNGVFSTELEKKIGCKSFNFIFHSASSLEYGHKQKWILRKSKYSTQTSNQISKSKPGSSSFFWGYTRKIDFLYYWFGSRGH